MDGKTIDQLTIAELKFECSQRELSTGGTKADLQIRLGEFFAEKGILANTVKFRPEEPAGTTKWVIEDSTSRVRCDSPPSMATLPPETNPPPQNPNSPNNPSLETRLAMLEACMDRFLDAQTKIAETMHRMELGMSRPTPEQSASASPPVTTRYLSGTDAHHSTSVPPSHPGRTDLTCVPPPTSALQRSILIPYEDLRAARHSLPEFYGTTSEDPVRFLNNSESILTQAHISTLGWTKTIEPQLKGAASTWWNTTKVLDLSWAEFRDEFLEKFDNPEIQSRLRADIVSVRQAPKQSLTEFILAKNQLARRIVTGLAEPQLVSVIAGLTRDEYRIHIRLQQPKTFGDLRRIAGILDPAPGKPPTHPNTEPDRVAQAAKPGTRADQGRTKTPPNPCRYCGGPHWNSECPNRATASGNGR